MKLIKKRAKNIIWVNFKAKRSNLLPKRELNRLDKRVEEIGTLLLDSEIEDGLRLSLEMELEDILNRLRWSLK